MHYYIIIRGSLGVGKSASAKKLAKLDDVLAENKLDKINTKEGHIPVKNFIKVNNMIIPKIKSLLNKNRIAVIDGNFYYKKEISSLVSALKNHKKHVFTLKASANTCMERDGKRENTYGFQAVKAVHKLVSRFDYGIIINTERKTTKQAVKKIILR